MIGQDEVQGTNAPTETDGRRGLFVFRVGATWLAVPADRVETVIQTPRPTPLPMVPPHVLGLVPYGQEALAIFDLASFLGMGQALSEEGTGYSRVLVLSTGTLKAAVPVAAAAGVAEVAPDALRAPRSSPASVSKRSWRPSSTPRPA